MFIFKKIFSKFLFPLPLILCLCLVGLYLLWFTKKQKLGKVFVSISVFFLLILSYGALPDALLTPLERKYAAYPTENSLDENKPVSMESMIEYVVVLGGGHTEDPNLPLTAQIEKGSLFRLIEGIRIHRKNAGSKLILIGGSVTNPTATATMMAELAIDLGVYKSDIITKTESKDTKDEARIIKGTVENKPFVLVTSASHMPRSMAMFKKLGMNPIPAPTEHNVKESSSISPGLFFPNAYNIQKADKAVYEYLGIIWAKLRGQI